MDGGQSPVRPEWPLFGGIGAQGRRLMVNDATPRCRSITLGLGRVAFYLICRVPTASFGCSPRMEVGADTARDFSAQQASRWTHGQTAPPANDSPARPVGRDGLPAVMAPDNSGVRPWGQRIPFGIVASHPTGPLVHLYRLPCRHHAHTRVELVAECHSIKLGTRIWLQQGSPISVIRRSNQPVVTSVDSSAYP